MECKSQGCITSSTFCTSSCRLSYCGSTQTCSNGVCISTTSSTGGSATSGGGGGSISTLNTGGTPACLPVWTCVWGECNNVGGTGIQSGNCTDT
ncbi:MAG: hypothetical protein QXK37_06285, partial [Candidatus Woesearchaeota archaeon]